MNNMETAAMNVGVERVLSYSAKVSNAEQGEQRPFDISARVSFEDGECRQILEGTVRDRESGDVLASFHTYNPVQGELSVGYTGQGNRMAIMSEVDAFVTASVALAVQENEGE